jgi:protein-tyrosine phosphatase
MEPSLVEPLVPLRQASPSRPCRTVELASVFNFRDLGGYRGRAGQTLRWFSLYRSDGLNRLAADDAEQVGWLQLSTVVDLRTERECRERGRFPREMIPLRYHHLPMLTRTWDEDGLEPDGDAAEFLRARYREMLDVGADCIAAALELLATPDAYPLVFHCAAGKDRTGVLAAVILGLLGVDDETIVADYALSGSAVVELVDWLRQNRPELLGGMIEQPTSHLEAPQEAMRRFLRDVRERHGSMVGYVRHIGVELETVERIHDHLLV